jgi:alanine racemase
MSTDSERRRPGSVELPPEDDAFSENARWDPAVSGATTRTPTADTVPARAAALIDSGAIEQNVRTLKKISGTQLMAVVKADGYGHGALTAARAALAGGADMLGVAYPSEALELRKAGIEAPILAWLWPPGEYIAEAAAAGVMLAVSSRLQLERIAATRLGDIPVHIKVDTGLGRNGVSLDELPLLCEKIAEAQKFGLVDFVGAMSHLASSEVPGDATTDEQLVRFAEALTIIDNAGLKPRWRHLANTAAAIDNPATRFDLVRCGIGIYGLDPLDLDGLRATHGLRPAMTFRSEIALTKRVPAGHGVSYNLSYRTSEETTLALIPVGYGDGIPRSAQPHAKVWIAGRQYPIVGRIAMDQVVAEVGDDVVVAGDEVVLFGDGRHGEPTAADWAAACGTIDYEIVTRIGSRVPRVVR